MRKINVGRWILGGIVAGIVLFIIDYILNGVILRQQWSDAMAALQKPMTESAGLILMVIILNLLIGLAAVWIYVGIRPRFGAGVAAAIYAGLVTWLIGYAIPNIGLLGLGILPAGLVWAAVIVGIIQVPLATTAGAYLYKEE